MPQTRLKKARAVDFVTISILQSYGETIQEYRYSSEERLFASISWRLGKSVFLLKRLGAPDCNHLGDIRGAKRRI